MQKLPKQNSEESNGCNNEFPQTSQGEFVHPSVYRDFAELSKSNKNKRKSISKEASELVGLFSGSSEAEDNTGHDYTSPSKKVKGDFFGARPLKLTHLKVNPVVLDYIVDEIQPLYTVLEAVVQTSNNMSCNLCKGFRKKSFSRAN